MPDNLRINVRAMTPDERGFAYTQPDLFETSGCIGHLRVDMGNTGTQFFSSWDDHQADLKTAEFKNEFDAVINALRNDTEYGGILASRTALASYCLRQPESVFENGREYGFRVDTDKYSYLLRLNPNRGEYAAYCHAYEKENAGLNRNSIIPQQNRKQTCCLTAILCLILPCQGRQTLFSAKKMLIFCR